MALESLEDDVLISHVYHAQFWDKPNIPWSSTIHDRRPSIKRVSCRMCDPTLLPNAARESLAGNSFFGDLWWVIWLCFRGSSRVVFSCFFFAWHKVSFWAYPDGSCFGMSPFTSLDCKTLVVVLDWVGSSSLETEVFCQERGGGKKESTAASTTAGQRLGKKLFEYSLSLQGVSMHLGFQWIPISRFRKQQQCSWEHQHQKI